MQYLRHARIGIILASAMLLLSLTAPPLTHAANFGPYSVAWDYGVWGNRSIGHTVEFDLYVYNMWSGDTQDTISSAQLVTPWQIYTAAGLPQTICYGCVFVWSLNATIPLNEQLGSAGMTVSFTGTHINGSPLCSSTGNVCSSAFNINIIADPQTLQTQVTALQQTVNSLNANVTSLKSQLASLTGQLATAKNNITSLQSKAISLQSQLGSVQSQLTTASNDLQKAKSDLTSTQSALTAANTQLDSTKATLASTQSSLATVSSVYLPAGVAVPAVIAALLAVLYIRKGSGPAA